MQVDDIRTLYEYNYWANERILRAASAVGQEVLTAPAPFPSGSLRGTLVHIMSAEWIWRQRWLGVMPTAMLSEADFPTLEAIRERWWAEEAGMRSFLADLTDAALQRPLVMVNTRGVPQPPLPLWQVMLHMLNHGTQHRSEAAAMLTAAGHSPGDIDLILFLRQRV